MPVLSPSRLSAAKTTPRLAANDPLQVFLFDCLMLPGGQAPDKTTNRIRAANLSGRFGRQRPFSPKKLPKTDILADTILDQLTSEGAGTPILKKKIKIPTFRRCHCDCRFSLIFVSNLDFLEQDPLQEDAAFCRQQ